MTDKEIDKLARELADELYNDDKTYNSILWWCEEPKERKAEELVHTLHILLRSHCIVEKSKVEHEAATSHYTDDDADIASIVSGQMLKRLFGDNIFGSQLGKEAKK